MKRTPLRRRSKSERSKLIKQCDDLVRQIVRLRDRRCQKTWSCQNLQVAHYISRSNHHLRWNLDNVVLLSKGVHYYWAHVHYSRFRQFMIDRVGAKKIEALEFADSCQVAPLKDYEIRLIRDDLKKRLEEMKSCEK